MKKIILTGFEPFGPYKFNPVEESTNYFNGKEINNYQISGLVLPCTYKGAFETLKYEISKLDPVAIVSTGLSSSVKGIRFETIGKNIMNGKYADANNYSPNNIPIIRGEDEFIETNCSNSTLANIIFKNNISTEISGNADTFICNSLIYLTSLYIKQKNPKIKNVFIHTPWTENYKTKIKLKPNKIKIPQKTLYDSIKLIVQNIYST